MGSLVPERNHWPRSRSRSTGSVTESRYVTMISSGTKEGERSCEIHKPAAEPSRWTKTSCRARVSRLSDPELVTISAAARPPTMTHVLGVLMDASSWLNLSACRRKDDFGRGYSAGPVSSRGVTAGLPPLHDLPPRPQTALELAFPEPRPHVAPHPLRQSLGRPPGVPRNPRHPSRPLRRPASRPRGDLTPGVRDATRGRPHSPPAGAH